MVECQLPKLDVAGSNPVSRSIFSISYRSPLVVCSICAPFRSDVALNHWNYMAGFAQAVLCLTLVIGIPRWSPQNRP